MIFCHAVVWQVVFALIPDIRQLLGAQVQTIDFVLSQCSGNGAVMLWMLEDYLWERKHKNG